MTSKSHNEIPWPHAPTHQLSERGAYFVTVGTYLKQHHFNSAHRLGVLERGLFKLCNSYGWKLEAWAIFSNHYHIVAQSPEREENAESLRPMLNELHAKTATWLNRIEAKSGRQVWFNFRETKLTFQTSYLARLNYVHQNAVKHGLVPVAESYLWCSAAWFERMAPVSMVKSIRRFKIDTVKVEDDYEPLGEW
jgi:putative transposase